MWPELNKGIARIDTAWIDPDTESFKAYSSNEFLGALSLQIRDSDDGHPKF